MIMLHMYQPILNLCWIVYLFGSNFWHGESNVRVYLDKAYRAAHLCVLPGWTGLCCLSIKFSRSSSQVSTINPSFSQAKLVCYLFGNLPYAGVNEAETLHCFHAHDT